MAGIAGGPLGIALTVGSTILQAVGQKNQAAVAQQSANQAAYLQQQQAVALQNQGVAQQRQAEYEAKQYEDRASAERATAQRAALEKRREARVVMGRVRSQAGSTTDPTVLNILAGIAGQGEYNALSALYEGEEAARGFETAAGLRRYEGAQDKYAGDMGYQAGNYRAASTAAAGRAESKAYKAGATSTLLQGGMSFYDKYAPKPEVINWRQGGQTTLGRWG